jgi:hypothetical protein
MSQGYDTMGRQYGDLPSNTPVKVIFAQSPNVPGLMTRCFETDPITGSKDVESPLAQSVILTSGNDLRVDDGPMYWSRSSGTAYPYPRVATEYVPSGQTEGVAVYPFAYGN